MSSSRILPSICRTIQASVRSGSRRATLDRYAVVQGFFARQGQGVSVSTKGREMVMGRAFSTSSPARTTKHDGTTTESSSPPLDPSTPLSPEHKDEPESDCPTPAAPPPTLHPHPHPTRLALFSTYPRSLQRLASLLPHNPASPHTRPTKQELLKLSDSFLQRMRIRWKWFTIRGFRRFTADEWSAVASWVLVGHLGWLVLGTTTFVGGVIWAVGGLGGKEVIARVLSDYFTQGSGIVVVFESALVPNFFDSTISLRNVFVSRRPKDTYPSRPPPTRKPPSARRSTSSSSIFSALHRGPPAHEDDELPDEGEWVWDDPGVYDETEDTNYSMFDLNIDSIDVTLSFVSWLNGEGLVKKAVVRGVRGVIDRRSVNYDPADPWIPAEWRHPTQPADGSFHLDSLQVEDLLVTVYQPGGFRPYNVSIFRADIGTFRKRWAFYDFLSAHSITGQYDNCLCSLHKPQRIGKTMGSDEKEGKSKRMARLRIDGLPIDHLQSHDSGPLNWITSGKLDGVCDIQFPSHPSDEVDFSSVLTGIIDNINNPPPDPSSPTPTSAPDSSSTSKPSSTSMNPGQRPLGKPALTAPEWLLGSPLYRPSARNQTREVIIDIDLRFRDLKAAVPFRTAELSYVNSALIRPIVGFINANRTLLPIQCRVVQDLSEFDGSWTPFETGLLDATSAQVYSALAHHVSSESANTQRMKAVGVWSLQMVAEVCVGAVRGALLRGAGEEREPAEGGGQFA